MKLFLKKFPWIKSHENLWFLRIEIKFFENSLLSEFYRIENYTLLSNVPCFLPSKKKCYLIIERHIPSREFWIRERWCKYRYKLLRKDNGKITQYWIKKKFGKMIIDCCCRKDCRRKQSRRLRIRSFLQRNLCSTIRLLFFTN